MKQIDKVALAIEYIEANLTKKLDLSAVADALHYSKYHLHRMFSLALGMTLNDYKKRRQLTEAAKLLVFSDKPILDIALLSGYESQRSFHGAFTAMYKISPSRYRANERFYPLQLKFELEGSFEMLNKNTNDWDVAFAAMEDIPSWMSLVRLVIDGFPHLNEDEHRETLKRYIEAKRALILKDGDIAVGIMLFSYTSGSIDFLGTHPLYRHRGIPRAFLNKAMGELLKGKEISITTFRDGDKADTGQRRQIVELGFAEADLLVEFGYPTQRFVLPGGTL